MAEVFGPSKDSIALWVKQLEKRLAILEEENEILKRAAIFGCKLIPETTFKRGYNE
ncbi:hypothetical protein [Pediococcus pentosaceus]|uniref:hypothetical protein n=1 Tax=Pediococcus pentosaceus TaxID=1255 RepID=UPI0021E77905|nr:hypothetical protein [Pediococcus pentosaceus]MCV3320549.1 hypothetical protein [Pediococcus pentosaceus]MDY8107473.1 hypothetical protein [Pediococcus pentosaceus]